MKLNEINSSKKYKFSCIYLWTNLVNNKKYVGQTRSFYRRMNQYRNNNFNDYMKKAIKKYGVNNFEITILEKDVPFEKLDEREQFWLDFYKSYERDNGYNICKIASSTYGYHHTEKSKKLMSVLAIKRLNNPEMRIKVIGKNNGMYGKKHSQKWKEEHSNFLKEKWKEEEYRNFWKEKMSGKNNHMYGVHLNGELNGMYGKKHSEETRAKISANLPHKKKVRCIETNKVYDSITQASTLTNTPRCGIGNVCKGKCLTSGGLHWEYVNQ